MRVLIIGLDGATWSNLRPLAERGVMPTLSRLLREGAWGVLHSSIPALTPPAWASLVTGVNVGKHGIYHFRHTPAGDYYARRLNDARDIAVPSLWQRLGTLGKHVGAMNVPLCHPVYAVNGFLTSDSFAPDAKRVQVHPPALAAEFRDYIVDVENYPTALPGSPEYAREVLAFMDENERVLASQADTAARLMKTQPWDFLMVAWMLTDRLGHYCWKYSDPGLESSLTTDDQKRLADRCRTIYTMLDTQIARLIETAGDNCSVVIASDHGFGPAPLAFFHTNRWLLERGYLRLLPSWHPRRLFYGNLPRSLRPRVGAPPDAKFGLVDWPRTQVWADPLESRAVAIRFNQVGRYPQGIVAAADIATLRDKIVRDLSDLKTSGGEKVFAELHRGESLYRGQRAEGAPDLVGILSRSLDVPASFRRDVRARELLTANSHVLRDGGHEPEGIFLLHGANIRPAGQLSPQPIEAIAPTVMQLFGLPIPAEMDAEPITAALTEDFLRTHPPRRETSQQAGTPAASSTPPSGGQPEYSAEDSAVVEERLRKLGYLD